MERVDVEQRAEKARRFFLEGYNCAQAVVLAYCDLFDISPSLAASISAPLGGGMGRLREVCGGLGIFTTDAKLSTEMMDKTVGALTVQQRLTYLEETAGKHFTESIEKIDRYSKEWYEAIARAELVIMEKKHEATKETEE